MSLFQPNLFQTAGSGVPGATNLSAIMDAIAASTPLAATKNVFAYPVESITPPAVIVGYPTTLEFDVTFVVGNARMVIPIYCVVGKVNTKSARDTLSNVIGGANELKAALESDPGLLSVVQTVRVTDCEVAEVTVAGVPYLAARFDLEVYA